MSSSPSAPPAPPEWSDPPADISGWGRVPPGGSSGAGRTPAQVRSRSTASTSGSGSSGVPWIFPGTLGGALLGATVGGPAVGLVGGLVGCAAGVFRDLTGQSVMSSWLSQPEEEKRQFLQRAGFMLTSMAAVNGGGDSSQDSGASRGGLTTVELDSLLTEVAGQGDPQCVLCYTNKVNVVFQPCGHAQVCSTCAAQVLRTSPACSCPICQSQISAISRIFIAGGA